MKIIGIGDSVLDEYVESYCMYPGGNSVNVPVLAKRCGAEEAAFIGICGSDYGGKEFCKSLEQEGVNISRIRIMQEKTARNKVHIDEYGDRKFVGNNGDDVAQRMVNLLLNQDDLEFIKHYDVVHTSYHSEIDEILGKLKGKTPISLDFSDAYDEEALALYCPLVDFAFLSAGDFEEDKAEELAELALGCGAETVVLTKGKNGSIILKEGLKYVQPAFPVTPIDALGAGDAYIASFLRAYFDTQGDVEVAARLASSFASQTCLFYGAFGHPIALM